MRSGDPYYTGESGEAYQRSVHGDVIASQRMLIAKSTLAAHRYFANVATDARIFEFGVGVGTNLTSLANEVRHGYDIGEFARNASRDAGIEVFDDMESVPRHSYDIVVCRHVLEHVTDPSDTLALLKTLLSDHGQLLIILPVERTDRRVSRLPTPDINNHLFAWGPQQIVNLLHANGLAPVRHNYFWYSMQGKLKWVLDRFGVGVYERAVTLAGLLRRQVELAVWVRVAD